MIELSDWDNSSGGKRWCWQRWWTSRSSGYWAHEYQWFTQQCNHLHVCNLSHNLQFCLHILLRALLPVLFHHLRPAHHQSLNSLYLCLSTFLLILSIQDLLLFFSHPPVQLISFCCCLMASFNWLLMKLKVMLHRIPLVIVMCYDTSVDEIRLFLGMIIAMGLHQLPAYTDYWSSDGFQVDMFNVMLKCLHSHGNTLCDPWYDRLHMVHPLLTQATDIVFHEYIPNRNISVDEAMIGFKV